MVRSSTISTATAGLVAHAHARVRSLTAVEFAERLDAGDSVLVDLRETDERGRQGSIRGAIHIPRGMLEFLADPTSPLFDARLRGQQLLLYCADGNRSALAGETLAALGYTEVAHLDGGVRAWSSASMPLYGRDENARRA